MATRSKEGIVIQGPDANGNPVPVAATSGVGLQDVNVTQQGGVALPATAASAHPSPQIPDGGDFSAVTFAVGAGGTLTRAGVAGQASRFCGIILAEVAGVNTGNITVTVKDGTAILYQVVTSVTASNGLLLLNLNQPIKLLAGDDLNVTVSTPAAGSQVRLIFWSYQY